MQLWQVAQVGNIMSGLKQRKHQKSILKEQLCTKTIYTYQTLQKSTLRLILTCLSSDLPLQRMDRHKTSQNIHVKKCLDFFFFFFNQCSQTEFWIIICKVYLQQTDLMKGRGKSLKSNIAPQDLQSELNLLHLQIATAHRVQFREDYSVNV